MSAITFSPADIQAIAAALVPAIVAQLRASTPPAPPALSADDVLTSAEVAAILRTDSAAALCRQLKKLGVRKLGWNRYRRGDIENAVARATRAPRKVKEAAK